MGVLIQELVPARFSGVLFTCHPNIAESLLVEYCRGPGDRSFPAGSARAGL